MKYRSAFAIAALLVGAVPAQAAQKAHQHGVARLDVAVEKTRITLQLESPLDNLLGFERSARTDAERKRADALVARFRSAEGLFRIDPAAQCTLGKVELSSSALKLGSPDPSEEGHADIDASFEFNCADATKAAYIDTGLFSFARMQRVNVQVATSRGEFRRDLTRPAGRIALAR